MVKGYRMKKVRNRRELARLLLDWIRPLKKYYSEGHATLHVGNTAAHYGEKSAGMEGFSRVLWGVGPLLATDNDELSQRSRREVEEWNRICLDGLVHGTDPAHEEYWGDVYDYDQKMVEMAAIVTTLLLASNRMWNPLTEAQKTNVREWLNQINHAGVHANNWRFFRILVNVFFTVQNLRPDEERLSEDLQVIEDCYDGDGWYFDGNPKQMDYYIPFAMHYYGLIYAHFMKAVDPERCETFIERAKLFCRDYIYWFGKDGSSVPFGRSLTYRFAHSAFFSAYAVAVCGQADAKVCGEVKGLLLRNLRYWTEKPIFDGDGILSIGYAYPNLCMSERYNAPGSPYWGLKAFLALALPAEHPFWQARERMVVREAQVCLTHPRMLITREENHVQMYPVGQHSAAEHGCCAAKYEKFVYSNLFGFSVPRGNTPESGAFDNTLAISPKGENFYRMRCDVENCRVTKEYTRSVYHIGKNVEIESYVIPLGAWHVRIHYINTSEAIDVIEGGYAVPKEKAGRKYGNDMIKESERAIFCEFPWGISGIAALEGSGAEQKPVLVQAFPNTNLLHNLTVIPMIFTSLEPGDHILVTCVYGDQTRVPEDKEPMFWRNVTNAQEKLLQIVQKYN